MDNITLRAGNSSLQNGKYIITKVLGQGGFGITYEAEQVSLGRKVAIKEFFMKEYCNRDGGTSRVSVPSSGSRELVERFRQKFLREARMIASLNHPNIVKIHDVFEENGTAYYVMEHLSGGSLSDKVHDNGPLSEDQCIDYICQVSSALDYLHRRNTLHFDVKPSNILFDEDGRAVLIDFGISKHYDTGGNQTSSTPVGLSKGYAPLEQYRQDDISTFTPATDIYSLGATLYYMATNRTPPDASIVNEDGLERPLAIGDCLWNTIERSMQPRRKDRPQSIKEFLSLFEGTISNADDTIVMDNPKIAESQTSPVSIQIFTPVQEPGKDTKKSFPKWLYGVIAILLVGLIVFLIMAKSGGETPVQEQIETPTPTTKPVESNPVEPKVVAVTSISLNKTSLILEEGESTTLTIKYIPSDATDKSTTWKSTDTKVVAVSSSGNVTAVKMGSAAIIASCGDKVAYCNLTVKAKAIGVVNGHEYVDLGLSVKWATCNVGASAPEEYGDYYAWGETRTKTTYTWENYRFRISGDSDDNVKFSKYNTQSDRGTVDNKSTQDLSDDVAREKWGGSWRMPTRAEQNELRNNCTWTWTTRNGVEGYKVTSKKSGYTNCFIFLPAAGDRYNTTLFNTRTGGFYWSSSLNADIPNRAYYLVFNSRDVNWNYDFDREHGLSVRAVCP